MNQDPLLIKASFVTHMECREYTSGGGKLDRLWDRIESRVREVVDEFGLELECYRSSVYAIGGGLKPDNSGRCAVCNAWVSAQNKPGIIAGLGIGAEYEGKFYCSKHLPRESEMYRVLNRLETEGSGDSGDSTAPRR